MFYLCAAVLISTVFLQGCASHRTLVYKNDDGKINYHGKLTKDANNKLIALYESSQPKPEIICIKSSGGNVMLGLDLGEFIVKNGLSVEVNEYCMSSCANYIFLAGRKKYLNPDSALVWHGGAFQKDLEENSRRTGIPPKKYLDEWQKREAAFFSEVEVDQKITIYGQMPQYSQECRNCLGYDYSLEDLINMGVKNIVEKNGSWNWRAFHKHIKAFRVKLHQE